MRKRPNDVEKLDQISQSIESDGKGNLTVGKNLGVDGKLTLKSLVSASNPDGDITKELGGGGGGGGSKIYWHHIQFNSDNSTIGGYLVIDFYSKNDKKLTKKEFSSVFDSYLICSGYVKENQNQQRYIPLHVYGNAGKLYVRYINSYDTSNSASIDNWNFNDYVYEVK